MSQPEATHCKNTALQTWQRWLSAICICLLSLGLVLYACVLCYTATKGELFVSKLPLEPNSDYLFWYVGGLVAASSERHHLYELSTLLPVWNQLIYPAHLNVAPAYVHPPYFAVLFIPFTKLALTPSWSVWTIAWLIFGWVVVSMIMESRKTFTKGEIVAFLIVMTVAPPSLACIRIGQLSWLVLALIGLSYYCFGHRRDVLGGIALSILSVKPHYFLFFVLPALIDKRWKILASLFVVEMLLLVAAGLVVGWSNVFEYPSVLLSRDQTAPAVAPHRMISLRFFFNLFLPGAWPQTASMVTMIFALGIIAFVWYQTLKHKPQLSNWAMALTVFACVVTSPHTHMYDALLLAIPAALTLETANFFQAIKIQPFTLRLWNSAFIAYALISSFLFFIFPGSFVQDLAPVILLVNILFLSLAAYIYAAQFRSANSLPDRLEC
jgi:hypothetical protein